MFNRRKITWPGIINNYVLKELSTRLIPNNKQAIVGIVVCNLHVLHVTYESPFCLQCPDNKC